MSDRPAARPVKSWSAALGNDLVDLAEAGAPGARFAARVFTAEERAWSARGPDAAARAWRLWAAKEAAFKALARTQPALVFAHARFRVEPAEIVATGRVLHGEQELPVRWSGDGAFVACVSWTGNAAEVRCATAKLEEALATEPALTPIEEESCAGPASRAARRLAKRTCAELLGVAAARLQIVRPRSETARAGRAAPEVWLDGAQLAGTLVSLSHHGRFAACAAARTGRG